MKVPVTVVLRLEAEVPGDWDADMIQFHVEENHCLDNYIEQIASEIAKAPNRCHTCYRGYARVGHAWALVRNAKDSCFLR